MVDGSSNVFCLFRYFPDYTILMKNCKLTKKSEGHRLLSFLFSFSFSHFFSFFFVFALHKIPQNRKLLADLGVWYKLRRLGPKKKEKKTKPRRCRIDQLQDSYPAWSPSQGDFTDLSQRQTLCQFWYATCLWIRRSASSQRAFCHFKCIRSPAWHEPYTLH